MNTATLTTVREASYIGTLRFHSRHTITPEQVALAAALGFSLEKADDFRAIFDAEEVHRDIGSHAAIVAVHPAAFLNAPFHVTVAGVFENANRAPEGAPPSFKAVRLALWVRRAGGSWSRHLSSRIIDGQAVIDDHGLWGASQDGLLREVRRAYTDGREAVRGFDE